ncbi:MAG: DUF4430 domain-containing protein [Lachnospiraceae bacterium]|nr:DUF4430 domain-containing protein [Lachnospiraceae bacterium]
MKRIIKGSVLVLIVYLMLVFSGGSRVSAKVVYDVDQYIANILDYNIKNDNSSDIASWIRGVLSERIGGTAEWYILGISQYPGFAGSEKKSIEKALASYRNLLEKYISENEVKNATARLKFSLAIAASGDQEQKGPGNDDTGISAGEQYIEKCMSDGTIGGLGVMSLIFGLHLVNNGYIYDDGTVADGNISERWKYSGDLLVTKLLAEQHKDGGWSVMGEYGDIDVTAMALQALAPCVNDHETEGKENGSNSGAGSSAYDVGKLKKAVERGVAFLSEYQLEDGAYKGFGVENAESTAQVLACLSALGIDCTKDERFIKNSNTIFDGLFKFALEDGSFSHELNNEFSATATVQVFYSLVSYIRMKKGMTPLYVLDSCSERRALVLRGGDTTDDETGDGGSEDGNDVEDTGENGNKNGDATGDENDISGEINGNEGDTSNDGNGKDGDISPDDNGRTGNTTENSESMTGEDGSGESVIGEEGNEEESNGDNKSGETVIGEGESGENVNGEEGNGETRIEDNNTKSDNGNTDTGSIDNISGKEDLEKDEDKDKNTDIGKWKEKRSGTYKIYAIAAILTISAGICTVFAIKKKHRKNYIFVAIVAAIAILTVAFTDIRSAESYYSTESVPKDEAEGKVRMSIKCDILQGMTDSEYVPDDGYILKETEFEINEGQTVYDILIEAARQYGISVDHKGGSDIVYISGINYLYELDYGDLSGWVYKVNGQLPSVGCAGYKLSDGDVIEWCYTLDLGNDSLD